MVDQLSIFDKDIQLIISAIIKECPKLISIILYGGFGRDEGSIIEVGDSYIPYNDYDVLLVVNNKVPSKTVSDLRIQLARDIGIRWVDISQKSTKELNKLCPSIFNYDLKYATKVIYGDESILSLIPSMQSSELPLVEGEVLFITRLWTLLGCLDDKGFNIDRSDDEVRFFRNQMAKAVLSVVDVLLLPKKAYNSSYRYRVQHFTDLYPEKEELCELSQWALEEKLFPKDTSMTGQEIEQLYSKVHRYYFYEMYVLLSKYYNTPIENPEKIEAIWKWKPDKIINRIGSIIIRWNFKKKRQLSVNIAQLYIACAYREKNIDKNYLNIGNNLIKKLNKNISTELTWDEARVEIARLRMEV